MVNTGEIRFMMCEPPMGLNENKFRPPIEVPEGMEAFYKSRGKLYSVIQTPDGEFLYRRKGKEFRKERIHVQIIRKYFSGR